MEKRVYIRFFGIIIFVILFFGFVFIFFNSDNLSITGNVVVDDDLEEEIVGDFNRTEEFFDDYKDSIRWLEIYFSCLNKCPFESEDYIEISCFNDCKDLAGNKEYELREDLYKEYPEEEVQFYFKDSSVAFFNGKVNTLLLCLDGCQNKMVCIIGCVEDFDKDPNEIIIPM